jgi:hypothetical protein
MSLARRSFRSRSMNMEMMKMAVRCPRLNEVMDYFDYGDGRTLYYTYDDESRTRRS